MRASDVINECQDICYKESSDTRNFILQRFELRVCRPLIHEEPRTPEQWCLDMVATKLARIYNSPDHLDNYLDAICYLAEAAALTKTPKDEL